jgi:adenylate cyclase
LCADVVGYSRLMGIDEEGTLTALRAVRRDLVDLRIAEQPRPYPIPRGLSMIIER